MVENAIVILDVKNNFKDVTMEYEYLEKKFEKCGKNWELKMQSFINIGCSVERNSIR